MRKGIVSVFTIGAIIFVSLVVLGAKPIKDKSHPFNPQTYGEVREINLGADLSSIDPYRNGK